VQAQDAVYCYKCRVVCPCVCLCLLVTIVSRAKTDEPIKLSVGRGFVRTVTVGYMVCGLLRPVFGVKRGSSRTQ